MPGMNKISTKALMDEFFKDKYPSENTRKKVQPQIDRQEVYAYEQKIGKQLVEMDVDELFKMILSFTDNRKHNSNNYSINYRSYTQISTLFRALFNYYIDNYEIIRNPFNDKRMRGTAATMRLAQNKEPFRWENVEHIIGQIKGYYSYERANYLECIILLFYNGFAKAQEIASLTEDMIDFKNKLVRLPGRTVYLSDRCFELLTFTHSLTRIKGWRGDYIVESWRGSYFKYIIRPKEKDDFDDRSLTDIGSLINKRLLTDIKKQFDTEINYRILYLLGFYDNLVKRYDEEKVNELILSVRDPKATEVLLKAAREYGVVVDSVTTLKRLLRPFVRV